VLYTGVANSAWGLPGAQAFAMMEIRVAKWIFRLRHKEFAHSAYAHLSDGETVAKMGHPALVW
jgi:hypothetical protein